MTWEQALEPSAAIVTVSSTSSQPSRPIESSRSRQVEPHEQVEPVSPLGQVEAVEASARLESADPEAVDIATEPRAAEVVTSEQVTAVLTAVLDRLGAAHHRPFSRG